MTPTSWNHPRERLSEREFCSWIGRAAPGEIIQYHLGHLAKDVASMTIEAADRAAWAAEEGLVHLVQSRAGPSDFRYLAIKRRRPRTGSEARAVVRPDPAIECGLPEREVV